MAKGCNALAKWISWGKASRSSVRFRPWPPSEHLSYVCSGEIGPLYLCTYVPESTQEVRRGDQTRSVQDPAKCEIFLPSRAHLPPRGRAPRLASVDHLARPHIMEVQCIFVLRHVLGDALGLPAKVVERD